MRDAFLAEGYPLSDWRYDAIVRRYREFTADGLVELEREPVS